MDEWAVSELTFIQRLGYATISSALAGIPYYWAAEQLGIPAEITWITYGLFVFGVIMVACAFEDEETTTPKEFESNT